MNNPKFLLAMRNAMIGSTVYRPARFTFQSLFDRAAISRRISRKKLYAQFIHAGDLVFDVGANIGNYTETFLSLGAKVVAVDPDPRNCAILQRRFGNRISMESCALGAAELHMCTNTALSTLSEEWVDSYQRDWGKTTKVPVSTMDVLKAKYGPPKHVKIDCEDYDYAVLCGMSFMPESLSFEFHLERMAIARSCLALLQGRKFNYTIGMDCALQLDHWVDSEDLFGRLCALPTKPNHVGDVYSIP
jgi:FkbM family methyltransferase